jgi:hypothetical protein
MRRGVIAAIAVTLVLASPVAAGSQAMPALYKNCKALNAKYPHGLGKAGAKDKTKSGDPVTTFKRNTKLYNLAMSHNKGLDRDKDGIACEKK